MNRDFENVLEHGGRASKGEFEKSATVCSSFEYTLAILGLLDNLL